MPLGRARLGRLSTTRSGARRRRTSSASCRAPTAPDEYVLYSAHWDHLGRCDAVDGDDICNGALDNATGTAGLIALAEAHAKAGPAKRIDRVPGGHRRGIGAARLANIMPRTRSTRSRRPWAGSTWTALNVIGAAQGLRRDRRGQVRARGSGQADRRRRRAASIDARAESREAAAITAPTISASPSSGVPMLYGESGEDLVVGGKRGGQGRDATIIPPIAITSRRTNMMPSWNWDGAVQDLTVYYALGRELADGDDLAQLVSGRRIPRDPRQEPRRAEARREDDAASRPNGRRTRRYGSASPAIPNCGSTISRRRARKSSPSPAPSMPAARGETGAARRRR